MAAAGCLAGRSAGGSGRVFSSGQSPPPASSSSWFPGQDCSFTREISRVAINTGAAFRGAVHHTAGFHVPQKKPDSFLFFWVGVPPLFVVAPATPTPPPEPAFPPANWALPPALNTIIASVPPNSPHRHRHPIPPIQVTVN